MIVAHSCVFVACVITSIVLTAGFVVVADVVVAGVIVAVAGVVTVASFVVSRVVSSVLLFFVVGGDVHVVITPAHSSSLFLQGDVFFRNIFTYIIIINIISIIIINIVVIAGIIVIAVLGIFNFVVDSFRHTIAMVLCRKLLVSWLFFIGRFQ